jgi:antirestriction protein ArdC
MKIAELYQRVTQTIIGELEQGAAPWIKPWKGGAAAAAGMPVNAATGHRYRGINVPILWGEAAAMGYPAHAWMTFKQAIDKGAAVRKGERGTHVVFTKRVTVGEEDDEKTVAMLRAYVVFNVAQIDGLRGDGASLSPPAEPDGRHDAAQRFIDATGADIRYGGGEAMFVPLRDFIALPHRSSFTNEEAHDATALHELGRWSGHKSRLNRDLAGRFGTRSYAAEELIAELTSAFLCAHLGITGELRHAGYIGDWLSLLREDDRAIFTAASKASQADEYLRSFSETLPDEER